MAQPIREKAIEIGKMKVDGIEVEYWIVIAPMENTLNGYALFKKRPVREQGYSGILTYVPVHGGITYAHEDESGMCYGFDTLHYDSKEYPRKDEGWIKKQIRIMVRGILVAKKVEKNYLRCITNKGKAKWAQMVQDVGEQKQRNNFGVCINLLSGQL
jgi:hypothetical protein